MIDNLIASAINGNKSHKAKLESVKLQIAAMLAIEAQLEEWISEAETATGRPHEDFSLTTSQIKEIKDKMADGELIRADVQSSEWAGIAIFGKEYNSLSQDQRDYAKRAIEFMVSSGHIKRVNTFSARRGRNVPSYEICTFPTEEVVSGD